MKTLRLTMGQALIKFLDNQYISFDGKEEKFVEGIFGIFGHGCVLGIGEALQEANHSIKFYQGKNEQGMAHAAIAYAKQNHRRKILGVTSSIGPGALNMVTAAGLATVNRIPLLLLPGDTFACRQPDPVLQQLEQFGDLTISSNDAFKPVCRYWDRISRPEQLMSAAIQAMRVLTSPSDTGAVCLALPQDVQAEAYDYPEEFFKRRVHYIERPRLSEHRLDDLTKMILEAKKPMIICGGGVRYSEADEALATLASEFHIPFGETQAGKSAIRWSHEMNLGGIGVTGGNAANTIALDADLILGVGTRLSDFTTSSKWAFKNPNVKMASINVNAFDAYKMDGEPFIADAKSTLLSVHEKLTEASYKNSYTTEIKEAKKEWIDEVDSLYAKEMTSAGYSQLGALGQLNENLLDDDAIAVGASGSLPGDLQRVWRPKVCNTYHMEYGFSCMGYEINGALGVKMARPNQEVYAFVGDGSFVMGHSELLASLQEGYKINILCFDNQGFGCIDNLQRSQGIPAFGCELKYRNPKTDRLDHGGESMQVDFAMIAKGYGCQTWTVHNNQELKLAIEEAKKSPVSTLIDIKVDFNSMSHGYTSWWRVGTPQVSLKESVVEACEELEKNIKETKAW